MMNKVTIAEEKGEEFMKECHIVTWDKEKENQNVKTL